jgi:hypothetical protein
VCVVGLTSFETYRSWFLAPGLPRGPVSSAPVGMRAAVPLIMNKEAVMHTIKNVDHVAFLARVEIICDPFPKEPTSKRGTENDTGKIA